MERHHRENEGGGGGYEVCDGDQVTGQVGQGEGASDAYGNAATAEIDGPDRPLIYLVDVVAAEAGIAHGRWVDATQDAVELEVAAYELLTESQFRGETTYVIQGTQGFRGFEVTEHEDLAVVSRVARGIAEFGRTFVAYVGWRGASQEAVEQFDDHYHGSWPDLAAWAEAVVSYAGWWREVEQVVPASLLHYVAIDYGRLGRDMADSMHVVEDEQGQEIHVFRPTP